MNYLTRLTAPRCPSPRRTSALVVALSACWLLAPGPAWARETVAPIPAKAASAAAQDLRFSPEDAQLFAQATQALRRGEIDEAKKGLLALQSRFPIRPEIINNLAVIELQRDQRTAASQLFTLAARTPPYYLSIYNNARRHRANAVGTASLGEGMPYELIDTLPQDPVVVAALPLSLDPPAPPSPPELPKEPVVVAQEKELAVALVAADVPAPVVPQETVVAMAPVAVDVTALVAPSMVPQETVVAIAHLAVEVPAPADMPAAAASVPPMLAPPEPAPAPTPVLVLVPPPLENALEKWRQAWQAQNIQAYLRWYADDFQPAAAGLSRAQWVKQRQAVFARPKETISIALRNADKSRLIPAEADTVEEQLVFEQSYQASDHKDQGQKTMRWRWKDGKWRILSESFRSCSSDNSAATDVCQTPQTNP